ncbi:MAG: M28 family peptidase [Bacteroidota bacterium]
MSIRIISSATVFLFLVSCMPAAKKIALVNQGYKQRFESHVGYLASDSLEGRRTGTIGEIKARDYIATQFRSIGLREKGTSGYTQLFEVNEGKCPTDNSFLLIQGDTLSIGSDYFFFPWSAARSIQDKSLPGVRESGTAWIIDLKEGINDNANNPHFDLNTYIYEQSKKAADAGATALLLYNTHASGDKLSFQPKDRTVTIAIPVAYLKKPTPIQRIQVSKGPIHVEGNIAFGEQIRRGYNVIGYIDNKAEKTVVLGAHYDHLGYGEDNNSRHTGAPAIHNGADDNASGTSLLIELARLLKTKSGQQNNYLFIAFSGEELGLYGSKYFTDKPTVDLKGVNYMINMDMVGRLADSTRTITLGGYGTSPSWSKVIDTKTNTLLGIRIDSSGTGPSDHSSFYRKDIPVLFYFTGLHTDYHKPSDDADRINYSGMVNILRHIEKTIDGLNTDPKLAFLKTREAQTTTTARFSVTMGIMPDYTYSGKGVRADGVGEGKPAQKAGIRAGDIILQIGEYNISSMESYMQTLGKFKKGETVKAVFQRGDKNQEVNVTF